MNVPAGVVVPPRRPGSLSRSRPGAVFRGLRGWSRVRGAGNPRGDRGPSLSQAWPLRAPRRGPPGRPPSQGHPRPWPCHTHARALLLAPAARAPPRAPPAAGHCVPAPSGCRGRFSAKRGSRGPGSTRTRTRTRVPTHAQSPGRWAGRRPVRGGAVLPGACVHTRAVGTAGRPHSKKARDTLRRMEAERLFFLAGEEN
nr:collagen alpha-1(X) chain-like [Vulpes vulpes]